MSISFLEDVLDLSFNEIKNDIKFSLSNKERKHSNHTSPIRDIYDFITKIPTQNLLYMFYNWMIRANKLIDCQNTNFYHNLPNVLQSFQKIIGQDIIDLTATKNLLWSIPGKNLRGSFNNNFFNQHPSLEIIQFDSENNLRQYVLTIQINKLKYDTTNYGPSNLEVNELSSNFNGINLYSWDVPETSSKKFGKVIKQRRKMKEDAFYKKYKLSLNGNIPRIDPAIKKEINNLKELSPCNICSSILNPNEKITGHLYSNE